MISIVVPLLFCAVLGEPTPLEKGNSTPPRPLLGLERLKTPTPLVSQLPFQTAEYPVDSGARGTVVLLLPKGPRTIVELEILPKDETLAAWRGARLRILWDTDRPEAPGVDVPMSLAFGGLLGPESRKAKRSHFGLSSGFLTCYEFSFVNRLPMPYRTEAMLMIDTELPLSGRIRLKSVAKVELDAGYLRGMHSAAGASVEEQGRGHLAAAVVARPSAADKTGFGNLVLDGKRLGLNEATANSQVQGSRINWDVAGPLQSFESSLFTPPVSFLKSFQVESRAAEGYRSAWFWYSERPSAGRSKP